MYTKTPLQGHFIKQTDSHQVGISEAEARRLLVGHCQDQDVAVTTLKTVEHTSYKVEGGELLYQHHIAPLHTVPEGGPVMRHLALFTPQDIVQHLLDLVARFCPITYPVEYDLACASTDTEATMARLMEMLDNIDGDQRITFTTRQIHDESLGQDILVLGFWPTEEETNEPA